MSNGPQKGVFVSCFLHIPTTSVHLALLQPQTINAREDLQETAFRSRSRSRLRKKSKE